MNDKWPYTTPGIPDNLFDRGQTPMTKEEIRTLTLAKTRLGPGQIVWDVGAGTGSLSVEAALLTTGGIVYAVEREFEGIKLIGQNAKKFQVANLVLVHGSAPDSLHSLPEPDRVIIGGSGGHMAEIIELCLGRLKPGGRIVINAVTMETITLCASLVKKLDCEITMINVARAVPRGGYKMWQAMNPVYLFTLQR